MAQEARQREQRRGRTTAGWTWSPRTLRPLALSHALLRALWAEQRDTADPDVRIAVANAQGLDGPRLQALETADETQAVYAVRPTRTVPLGRLCSLHGYVCLT